MRTRTSNNKYQHQPFFIGGGEMGERMRSLDWSKTPVGPVENWPQSLRAGVNMMLNSAFPMFIWWGKEATSFYNDAYIPVLGKAKHPQWLGRSAKGTWQEIWDVIGPLYDKVIATAQPIYSEDLLLLMDRNLPLEETYYTFSYSPVLDDGGQVGGVFCACTETTARVVGERRLRTLRDLGAQATVSKSVQESCLVAANILNSNTSDIPFSLLYLTDSDGKQAHVAALSNLEPESAYAPQSINLADSDDGSEIWPLRKVQRTGIIEEVDDIEERFGHLPGGPLPESSRTALILPLAASGSSNLIGFVVLGVSPRRVLDNEYRSFFNLVANHISSAIANAHAYEEERKRAEALAELDRAKTTFFSNVSHEFRTPLTLMLGPIEDALHDPQTNPANQERMDVAHRNALRLLKLVNNLLDFSRIEAGRMQAVYEPTDLAAFTADLASGFRSAIEKAGMKLVVDLGPVNEPVYIDREMWEKIVLNLLSNAFKFTFNGEITVSLRQKGNDVELSVKDTGVGIPEQELPHIFRRFHRAQGTQGRTYEGTGIGLSLVQELVKLHGGTVGVQSEYGKGSAFTVAVPLGTTHLPKERISGKQTLASTALGAHTYVDEALRWLPGQQEAFDIIPGVPTAPITPLVSHDGDSTPSRNGNKAHSVRILLADDNADMREYVTRLLRERYEVEAVADGRQALASAKQYKPDLVLTDVMMPNMDGFELLKALRDDPDTSTTPIIMLSARAGEESHIEGVQAGADDYLIKPFSARELLARVGAHLEMARIRKEATQTIVESEERFRNMADAAPVYIGMGDEHGNALYLNKPFLEFLGKSFEDVKEFGYVDSIHPDDLPRVMEEYMNALKTHAPFEQEFRFRRHDGEWRWVWVSTVPRFRANGTFMGYVGSHVDITDRKKAEEAILDSEQRLTNMLESISDAFVAYDKEWRYAYVNEKAAQMVQMKREDLIGKSLYELFPESVDTPAFREHLRIKEEGKPTQLEYFSPGANRWIQTRFYPSSEGLTTFITDISEQKKAEESNRYLATLTDNIADAVISTDKDYKIVSWNKGAEQLYGWQAQEVVGKSAVEVIVTEFPNNATGRKEWQEALIEQGYWRGEVLQKRKDGSAVDILASIAAIKDAEGEIIGGVAVNRDITDRKAVEQELAKQSRTLDAILSSVQDYVYIFDREGRFVFANKKLLDLWGLSSEEAIGKTMRDLNYQPEVETELLDGIRQVIETKDVVRNETFYTSPVGTGAYYDNILSPILVDPEGEVLWIAGSSRDITERKKLEQRKDDFIALASHELKTPVTSLKMHTQLLKRRFAKVGDEETTKQLGRMDDQINKLTGLVVSLLDVSRVEAGKVEFEMENFALDELISEVIDDLQKLSDKHSLVVDSLGGATVRADKERVRQVLVNLITNATKYSPGADKVLISSKVDKGKVTVSVQDFGIGVAQDHQDKVFDRFFQAGNSHRSQTDTYPGLGLGLYISSEIVKRHGGRMWVESKEGEGSIFRFTLPISSPNSL